MRGGSTSPTDTDARISDDDNHSYYSHYSDGSMGLAKKKSKKLSLVSYIPMTEEEEMEGRSDSAHFRFPEYQSEIPSNSRRDPPTTTKQHVNSFDHSSSTHKTRGGGGGKSSRRRPTMSVIRDDEELPDYKEESGMGRPVAENLADVNPTTLDPLSPEEMAGVDAAETRSRRRDRLSRLSRVRSPPRHGTSDPAPSDHVCLETRDWSLSPTKRNHNRPSALKSPKYTLSPDSMTPQTADPHSPQRKMHHQTHPPRTYSADDSRDFRDERHYATHTKSPTSADPTSPQVAVYQQAQYPKTTKGGYSKDPQEEKRYENHSLSAQNAVEHNPQEGFVHSRQMSRNYQEDYKPELTMPSLPRDHADPHARREKQYRHETSRTSYASDTSSVVTSNLQHGVPCVSTSHVYGQYPAGNHGKGWSENCSSFVSGVWESCSNITRYQTESKRNLLQLEMIAEQSLSSIYQTHGRTSPDAFRHTRDLLDKAKKAKQDTNSRQLTAVMSDETIGEDPMKNNFGMKAISTLRDAVGLNDGQTNEPQSIMDDMRNLFDSFSTYYAPHHQPYDGGVDSSGHGVYQYRHGTTTGTPFDLSDAALHSDEASDDESIPVEQDDDERETELSGEAARTSIYQSVVGATRDRRSMVLELQKRRMKQVNNKKKEEMWDAAPRKVEDETAKLRMVYLGLYDKIHEEKPEANVEEVDGRDDAQNTVVTAETADDEREYAVVWAASECSLDSPQHPMTEPEEGNDEETVNEVGPPSDAGNNFEEQTVDEVAVVCQDETPTREQVDAPTSLPKQPTRTVDSDETDMFSAAGTECREEPDPTTMSSEEDAIPIVKTSGSKDGDKSLHTVHTTATTTTSEMDELVHSFLAHDVAPVVNDTGMENEEDDQWSVHSDPTLADSSIMSGLSGSRQTQDTSMADSILSASQSGTHSSGRQYHDHFGDEPEFHPDFDEHTESISEYQVLYQISEEDEEEVACEEEDDASFEPMNDVPFDEDVTMEEYSKKQDGKKLTKGKRFLQWILVVCLAYYLELIDLAFVNFGISEPIVVVPVAMESAPQQALWQDAIGEVESKPEPPVFSRPKIVIESPASLAELFPENDLPGESAPGNELYRNAWADELREALEEVKEQN